VRTALFRLNKEEWLDVVRIGRRSFYRLSDKGLRLTRRAEHKIYRASAPEWDGTWLLLLGRPGKNVLADVKKQLLWIWRAGAEPAGLAVAKAGGCPVAAPRSGRRRKRHLF
jgi:phenylacetic acid degradation operon negative regulatory protein